MRRRGVVDSGGDRIQKAKAAERLIGQFRHDTWKRVCATWGGLHTGFGLLFLFLAATSFVLRSRHSGRGTLLFGWFRLGGDGHQRHGGDDALTRRERCRIRDRGDRLCLAGGLRQACFGLLRRWCDLDGGQALAAGSLLVGSVDLLLCFLDMLDRLLWCDFIARQGRAAK